MPKKLSYYLKKLLNPQAIVEIPVDWGKIQIKSTFKIKVNKQK